MSSKSEDDSLPATLLALKMEEEAKSAETTMVSRSLKKQWVDSPLEPPDCTWAC